MKEKFAISLISQLSSNLLQLIAYYLLFLNLDVAVLGSWAYLNSVINLGFLFVNIGLDSIHYQYSGKKDSTDYFGTFFFIKLGIILIHILISFILLSILQLWTSMYFILVSLLLCDKVLVQVVDIFLVNLKTKIKVFKAELPALFIMIGKSMAYFFLIFNLSYFIEPLLYLSVSNLIFDFIFIIVILQLSKKDYKINKPIKNLALNYLKDVKPLIFFSIILIIAANSGNLILDHYFGHESLGYVSLVSSYILPILFLISGSMVSVYLPLFSQYFEEGNISSIKQILYLFEKYNSIIFLSILIVVLLNGELMLSIFLPKYINSVPILYIMILKPFIIGITQPFAKIFIAGKKQKTIAKIDEITLIIITIAMLFLIPESFIIFKTLGLGTIGYAIAQTAPIVLWSILVHFYSNKYFKIKFQKNILFHIILTILTLIVAFIIKKLLFIQLFENEISLLISSSLVGLGIFFGTLFLFKELEKKDIVFFLQLFQIRGYMKSLKEEI